MNAVFQIYTAPSLAAIFFLPRQVYLNAAPASRFARFVALEVDVTESVLHPDLLAIQVPFRGRTYHGAGAGYGFFSLAM